MITLKQFLETQNIVGVRQSYFYRIVDALCLFQKSSETEDSFTISKLREGTKYLKVDSIPEDMNDKIVYGVEACYDEEAHSPYLKIVVV